MPSTKEMLLNILKNAKKDSLPPFQNECLDMFQEKINAIPVNEITEMDLRISAILLDRCFCDLDSIFRDEQRIISLINKKNLSNHDFFKQVNQIFDDEIKTLNSYSLIGFHDQLFKNVKAILIHMKTELSRLKTSLDQRLIDSPEYQTRYGLN
ncbi:TPA: hypothetical protein ACPSKZ_003180 [Legionella anisa]